MPLYEMKLSLEIEADNKIEASDIIKELFEEIGIVNYSAEVDSELFAELGIQN